jgi:hypothetical protein
MKQKKRGRRDTTLEYARFCGGPILAPPGEGAEPQQPTRLGANHRTSATCHAVLQLFYDVT